MRHHTPFSGRSRIAFPIPCNKVLKQTYITRFQLRTNGFPSSTTLNFTDFSGVCRMRADHSIGMSSTMSNTGTQSRSIFRSRLHVRLASLPWKKTQPSRLKRQLAALCSCSFALAGIFQDFAETEIPRISRKTTARLAGSSRVEPCSWWPDHRDSFHPRGGGI